MVSLVVRLVYVEHEEAHRGVLDTGNQATRVSHPLQPDCRFPDTLSLLRAEEVRCEKV